MTKRQKIRTVALAAAVLAALASAYCYGGRTGRDAPRSSAIAAHTPSAQTEACVCTLSIRCDTLLSHLDTLDASVAELVPESGALLAATEVPFEEGESVFDLLLREARANGIPVEFSEAPLYGSAYIEGIGNLYEFDCGELSGWMYRVNGEFPHYGCSNYPLQGGDAVEWVYTCDLGADVGSVYNAWQTE